MTLGEVEGKRDRERGRGVMGRKEGWNRKRGCRMGIHYFKSYSLIRTQAYTHQWRKFHRLSFNISTKRPDSFLGHTSLVRGKCVCTLSSLKDSV